MAVLYYFVHVVCFICLLGLFLFCLGCMLWADFGVCFLVLLWVTTLAALLCFFFFFDNITSYLSKKKKKRKKKRRKD